MTETFRITVVGLGPGNLDLLTLEAANLLSKIDQIHLRTSRHPVVDDLRARFPGLDIKSFDSLYEKAGTFEEVYSSIVAQLIEMAHESDVTYAVPGSPVVDETTVQLLRDLAEAEGIPTRVVHGLSYVESILALVGKYNTTWLTMFDAFEIDLTVSENALGEVPGRPGRGPLRLASPTSSAMVSQVHDRRMATSVKLWLSRFWPDEHEVVVLRAAGTNDQQIQTVALHMLDRVEVDHLTSVFVPAVAQTEDVRTFGGLLGVTRTLRAPGGCPWDREQTHDSLKHHLLDEAYEVIEALDEHDYDKLLEELGDLLFQITIHSQIAAERDEFDVSDVIDGITSKLIRRHPHVFSDIKLPTSAAVLERWESMKQAEKPERPSVLSSIPIAMPALPYSYAVQKRVANQGFEWPNIGSLLAKVEEEVAEVRESIRQESRSGMAEELGDLLFTLVSLGQQLKVDPEESLRRANRKFVTRFQFLEAAAKAEGKTLRDHSPEEIDELWKSAKAAT